MFKLSSKQANRIFLLLFVCILGTSACQLKSAVAEDSELEKETEDTLRESIAPAPLPPSLDTAHYNQLMLGLVHNKPTEVWPVKADYPLPGALLPFHRIIAYYGNLYSKGMGILGELSKEKMMKRLQEEVAAWQAADSTTKVIPALHYIAVTAQLKPGAGNTYRLRMPFHQIDTILRMASQIDAIVFIDIQVGHSTLEKEIPEFREYLKKPNVHLGIDPEYSMKNGRVPGSSIGTFDAADINYATQYLADLVKEHNIPPKILVVHRFTKEMVTNYKKIETRPEVQIVMHMDGFGFPAKKINSYKNSIEKEPVQFAGFKIFYKNDTENGQYKVMGPSDVLSLYPKPVYIQYQ
jgi:hypothetical protein